MDTIQLQLTHQERDYLVGVLETALNEKHAEARRTESSKMQDLVHGEEKSLRRLLERLKPPVERSHVLG
jgi:hypothetical protein